MEVLKIVNEKDETIHDLQKQLYEGIQIELYIIISFMNQRLSNYIR